MPLIFQYGSNCDAGRLNGEKRLAGDANDLGRAETVDEHDICFDVWSQGNGCAAADLLLAPGSGRHAWGVLYQISDTALAKLRQIEGKYYEERRIIVRNEAGEEVEASTFLVKMDARRQGLWTSVDYVGHIVKGLREHEIAEEYVQHVIDIAIETNRKALGRAHDDAVAMEKLRNSEKGQKR